MDSGQKKNSEYIRLERFPAWDWKSWKMGLNKYYPSNRTILTNHISTSGSSSNATAFKRQECRDTAAEEFDLLSTRNSNRLSVLCTTEERQEDMKNIPNALDILSAPSLSAEKAMGCENKIRSFAPTEEVKQYYTHLKPEHKEQPEQKKAARDVPHLGYYRLTALRQSEYTRD